MYKVKLKKPEDRKKKKETYDNSVKPTLVKLWEIFNYPCGQRLKILIKNELERLHNFDEIFCSNIIVEKLKRIGIATIDRKLKYEKEVLMLGRKYVKKNTSTILNLIPIKTAALWGGGFAERRRQLPPSLLSCHCFFKSRLLDLWIKFGKIRVKVCKRFNSAVFVVFCIKICYDNVRA